MKTYERRMAAIFKSVYMKAVSTAAVSAILVWPKSFYVCVMQGTPDHINQLVDHLYRHESGKLVAVLTRVFGTDNIELAEDVVQDSLIEAMKDWPYKGLPSDPSAWLYKVAKNKALNILNKEKYKRRYAIEAAHQQQGQWNHSFSNEPLFSEDQIQDDQLRMIFTSCHPSLSKDSQVALTLKTLCGFSIPEIAHAFFTTEDTINKRLVRARQKIREAKIPFEVPAAAEMEGRLEAVLETLYLVFNEGYSASSGDAIIRYELCEEAIRLSEMIAVHPAIQNKSNIYAAQALMLLNASRFASRMIKKETYAHLQNRTGAHGTLHSCKKDLLTWNGQQKIMFSPSTISWLPFLPIIAPHLILNLPTGKGY
jgi:RNA polymerase sigma factor (sigma-70 family)